MIIERQQAKVQMSTKEYRDIKRAINASAIKLYIKDTEAFYKEIVCGEPRKEKGTASTLMGSLVHCLLLEPREKFDEQYTITQMVAPSGQMLELVNTMYNIDCRTRVDGHQSVQFESIFMEAVQEVKFRGGIEELMFKKKTPEWILAKFTEPDKDTGIAPEQFYKEMLLNHGKQVVTMYQIEKAERIAQEMRENAWIDKWINARDNEDQEVYSEYPIQFKYKELQMKALIDRFIVSHKDKTIEITDIKSTWDADGVGYTYTNNLWYIQAAVYDMAINAFIEQQELTGYKVVPIRWLICDTTGWARSHSYLTTGEDLKRAYNGFHTKSGRYYPGVIETLDSIIWSWENIQFRTSREIVEANGTVGLDIPYM